MASKGSLSSVTHFLDIMRSAGFWRVLLCDLYGYSGQRILDKIREEKFSGHYRVDPVTSSFISYVLFFPVE